MSNAQLQARIVCDNYVKVVDWYPHRVLNSIEHGRVRSRQFCVTRYFFVTPAHVSTPIYPTGTQGIPAVSVE